ncbi:hypothetical protein HAX54_000293 [Datura stramonium]|uniref:Uncharacterized protein n=1 Tax=Datura stramonium TaxID=4076 RepID=A0ABS8T1S6_DATST|nr:hypothetical protein [Datura stramonium]
MNMRRDSVQVVMLPWLAFGHMPPFFQLSIALAKQGVHRNFPLPKLDDMSLLLPHDAEATVDIPHEKVVYLKAADLQDPIKRFIARKSPIDHNDFNARLDSRGRSRSRHPSHQLQRLHSSYAGLLRASARP